MINGVKIRRDKKRVGRAETHRRTILTTDRKTFSRVKNLKEGEVAQIECPNDIISSARNGRDAVHHSIRRVSLLRRQAHGGYRRVNVRYEQGNEIHCIFVGEVRGANDASSFAVRVKKV